MSRKTTTTVDKAVKSTKEAKSPRTVKLSTIIWVISTLVALGAGFYLGQAAREAYSTHVKHEAQSIVESYKLDELKL